MKPVASFFLLLLISTLLSCKENNRNLVNSTYKIQENDFSEIDSLKSTPLSQISDSLFIPTTLTVVDDHLIISERTGDSLLHLINLENNKREEYLGRYLRKGDGPKEARLAWKLFPIGKKDFGLYDADLRKVMRFYVDSLIMTNESTEEFQLDFYGNGISILDSNFYYLNANDRSSRFFAKNISNGKVKGFGSLPKLKNDKYIQDERDKNYQLEFARLERFEQRFLITYYNIPYLEIYDLKKKSQIGIEWFDPMPGPKELGRRTYFASGQILDNKIYLLSMAGNPNARPRNNEIFVLDSEGNPLQKLVLDTNIFEFQVYNDIIFALTSDTNSSDFQLIKFRM
ncbi:BF3164 family lipoprotein [Algoriphagus hitonicola]|uniref:TolB-like 6-blade propeller-like n=1 Tax=Algoriphagus hitonicola TaxID=435880 RepID=A0A1I2Q3Q0_9BACT|nr:BF3164 family lipoprotein [Algoriphagus hitonicola]SFG22918.1 TolB-like 6-blade propeller-like [Algoriphagus hitonicola]